MIGLLIFRGVMLLGMGIGLWAFMIFLSDTRRLINAVEGKEED